MVMFKRLVDNKGIEFYIDRDKVSMLRKPVDDDTVTIFRIDGVDEWIAMNFENAILWFISSTPNKDQST